MFVGGSLEPAGGHNPLEPAMFGKVPVFGGSMDNFRDIAAGFLAAEAAVEVRSGPELGAAWIALLSDRARRERMGQAARELVERHRERPRCGRAHRGVAGGGSAGANRV